MKTAASAAVFFMSKVGQIGPEGQLKHILIIILANFSRHCG